MEHGWYSFLKEHTLFPIANNPNQKFYQLAQELDAFVITGGDDSTLRRITELKLATTMLAAGKPVIGICHGCFLLVEVLGGIVGHIDSHYNCDHSVEYNGEKYTVNSYHSLSIDKLHSSAVTLATDCAGHCEAWVDSNVAGMVWHPERMAEPFVPVEIRKLLNI